MFQARPARTRWHPAWAVAGATFLVLLLAAGVRSVPSVLIVPLEADFGWSRATVSFAVAVNIMLFGLAGPFAAAVFERFGIRRVVAAALVVIATGVGLTPLMRQPWQLVALWGLVVGSGSGVVALVLGTTIATRWFHRRRGLVMGVLTASTATGQLVFLQLLAWLQAQYGWRSVSLVVAALSLLATVPVLLLIRDRPADLGVPPYGADAIVPPPAPTPHPVRRTLGALRAGLRSRDFWLLSGSFFICGASTNGLIGTHLIPACVDHGIPEVAAAGLLTAMGIFDFFGTTLSGWLSDRFDNRVLLAWYYGLRGLSLMFLPYAFGTSLVSPGPGLAGPGLAGMGGLAVFAVFYGLDWIATVPPTVRLAAKAFGEENTPVMFGWIAAAHQAGASAAAWGAGVLRTETGDYWSAFVASGALCLLASITVAFIGWDRRPAAVAA